MAGQERRFADVRQVLGERKRHAAMRTLPLREADVAVLGHHSEFVQHALDHDADDPFWQAMDHRHRVAEVTTLVSLVAGWYDIFLAGQLADFDVLAKAGRDPRITIGPWPHASLTVGGHMIRESVGFGLAHATGEQPPERVLVRLFVMGEDACWDFAE